MKKTFLLISYLLCSCSSGLSPDQKLEKELKTIESQTISLSESDWEKIDSNINLIKAQFESNRNNLTQDQIDSFNMKMGRYYALKMKSQINEFKNVLKDTEFQLKGAMKELLRDSISN